MNCEELTTRLHGQIELKFFVDHFTGIIICSCNFTIVLAEIIKAVNDNSPLSEALNKIRYVVIHCFYEQKVGNRYFHRNYTAADANMSSDITNRTCNIKRALIIYSY